LRTPATFGTSGFANARQPSGGIRQGGHYFVHGSLWFGTRTAGPPEAAGFGQRGDNASRTSGNGRCEGDANREAGNREDPVVGDGIQPRSAGPQRARPLAIR